MANHNDYDGLHVVQNSDRLEHSSNNLPIHASEAYKPQYQSQYPPQSPSQPQYNYAAKEPANTISSPPHYSSQTQSQGADSNRRRNPWGLSPLAFAALVALITAVIIGGAVGGGMGSAISSARTSCQTSTSSVNSNPTATSAGANTNTASGTSTASTSISTSTQGAVIRNYVPPAPSKVESLANDCDSINGTTQTSAQGTRFRITCPQAILGSSGSQGITLSETVAYSLIDCINACSLMNFWTESTVCNSITWDNGMAGATSANFGGNCWLFRDSGVVAIKANSTSARVVT